MVPQHRHTEEQCHDKSPNIDEHYGEIGISAVRASVRYVVTDSREKSYDNRRCALQRIAVQEVVSPV